MSFTQIYAPPYKKSIFKDEESHALGVLIERFRSLLNSLSGKVKERLEIKRSPSSLLKEFDIDLDSLEKLEVEISREIDVQMKLLESVPRSSVPQRRAQLRKWEREWLQLRDEARLCKNLVQKKLAPPNDLLERNSNEKETSTRTITSSGEKKLQQGQIQQPTSSSAIDQALEEERLQEIRKINSDLVLVNEMFRDMAELIRTQDAPIEEIASSTEKSNERVKEGLRQIEMAAEAQPKWCTIA